MINNIKEYMISVLIVTAILKISSIIIDSTKFSKTYKIASGLIITITIMSPVIFLSDTVILKENNFYNPDMIQNDNLSLNQKFSSNLETLINDDLCKQFGENYSATVECDETFNFQIYLSGNHSRINEVAKYVKSKYCMKDNEVILH